MFGSVLGFTIFISLITRDLPQSLPETLSELQNLNFISLLRSFNLRPFELETVLRTYSIVLHGIWHALAAVGALAFLITLLMKDISLEMKALESKSSLDSKTMQCGC